MAKHKEWELLAAAVGHVLAQGRLGRPSFARFTVQVPGNPTQVRASLEVLITIASGWFGGEPPESVYLVDSQGDGHCVTAVRWPHGPSAIVSLGPAGAKGRARTDLVLLGSKGSLYYATPESA